jgi:pilin isopeptide linkage protein
VTDLFTSSGEYIDPNIVFFSAANYYLNETCSVGSTTEVFDSEKKTPVLTWNVGTLDAGATATLTYTVTLNASYYANEELTNVANQATVTWGSFGKATDTTSDTYGGVVNIKKTHAERDSSWTGEDGRIYSNHVLTVTAPSSNKADMENIYVVDYAADGDKSWTNHGTESRVSDYEFPDGIPEGTKVVKDAEHDQFIWYIDKMEPGQTYTLNYNLIINTGFLAEGSNTVSYRGILNTATVYQKIDDDTSIKFGESSDYVEYSKYWIEKSGTIQDDGSILFNVVTNLVKGNNGVLVGVNYIDDTLTGPFKYTGDITVVARDNKSEVGTFTIPVDDIQETIDSNTHYFKIELSKYTFTSGAKAGESAKGAYEYTLTYKAVPTNTVGGVYSNSASVGVGDGTSDVTYWTHKASVSGITYGIQSLTKEYVSGVENMKWRITLDGASVPAGTVVKDLYPSGLLAWWYTDKAVQYTQKQLDSIEIKDGNGNVVDKSYYTVTPLDRSGNIVDTSKSNASTTYDGFQIVFDKAIDKGSVTIEFCYTFDPWIFWRHDFTSFNITMMNSCTMTSSGQSFSASAKTPVQYNFVYPIEKFAGDMDWADNILSWYVGLNKGSYLKDGNLIEYIPEGQKFVGAEIDYEGSGDGANGKIELKEGVYCEKTTLGTPVISEPTEAQKKAGIAEVVTIPVNGLYTEDTNLSGTDNNGYVKIRIKTRITDEDFLYGGSGSGTAENSDSSVSGGVTKEFTNSVDFVESANTNHKVSATGSTELTSVPLVKSVSITNRDTRPYICYTLKVNTTGLDYLEDGDWITVVDEMSKNMNLAVDDEHSLKVTTTDGTDITDQCTLTIGNDGHGFSLDVPDATALTVTYYVTLSGLEYEQVDITNKAYFYGQSRGDVESSVKNVVILSALGQTTTGACFTIQKSDQHGNDLPDVQFRISKVVLNTDGTAQLDEDGQPKLETIDTRTTDESGQIYMDPRSLNDSSKSNIYVLEEVSAPDGYVVDTERVYLQITAHEAFAKQFPEIQVESIINSAVIARYNEYKITSLQLAAAKTLTERAAVTSTASGETFTFTLSPSAANTDECYTDEAMTTTFESGSATVTGAGKTTFDRVYFPKVGTYTFTLTEDALTDAQTAKGYTHDDSVYTITVTVANSQDQKGLAVSSVTMSKNGAAAVDLTDSSVPTFDNGYKVSAKLVIPVAKDVSGIAADKAAGKQFSFALYAANEQFQATGETPIKTTQVMLGTDGTGTGAFDSLLYAGDSTSTGVGTYYYILKETGSVPGFKANATTHTLKVVVSDDGTDSGVLTISAELDGQEVTVNTDETDKSLYTLAQAASWTNIYTASGSVKLSGTKTLERKDGRTESQSGGEFTFQVLDENGNVVATGTNQADGSIAFDSISYSSSDVGKTYTYTVTESAGTDEDITYSTASFRVSVSVADNGDGTLSVTPQYLDGDIQFVNQYHPVEAVTLPETGGMGTQPFTFGGTAFITTASLMYICIRQQQKHKRKGGANPQILHRGR